MYIGGSFDVLISVIRGRGDARARRSEKREDEEREAGGSVPCSACDEISVGTMSVWSLSLFLLSRHVYALRTKKNIGKRYI